VRELGGFQTQFNGSQDHDLALRVIEKLADNQICHVPRVLYHWRAHRNSTASAPSAKSYTHDATIAAVNAHLVRAGINAQATSSSLAIGKCRVQYRLPDQQPSVDIIIPTRDQAGILKQCIDSIILKTTYKNFRIRVIDNGSVEAETAQLFNSLMQSDNVEVIRDDSPFNYSALNNRAVASSTADFVCLLNNDIEIISPDWLSEMVSNALRPDVGAVGARLWYPNDTLQHGGVVIGILGVAGHSHKHLRYGNDGYFSRPHLQQRFSAVTAACMLVKRTTYLQAGGLNETDLTVAFNDIDFCLKLGQLGKAIVWTPYADCYHHESVSRGYEDNPEKQARFAGEVAYMKKIWRTDEVFDKFYSPNLTLANEDFTIAWPPRMDRENSANPNLANALTAL
jgi:O-antigen biosynthesis protein